MAAATATRSRSSKPAAASKASPDSPSPAPVKDKAKAGKGAASKPAAAKSGPGPVTQMYRRFAKDTSGTYRFEAVDDKGVPLAQDDKRAHATQLYIRRTSDAVSADPRFLIVTIQEVTALPKGAKAAEVSADEDED